MMSEPIYVLGGQSLAKIAVGALKSDDLANYLDGAKDALGAEENDQYRLVITGAQLVRQDEALPAPLTVVPEEAI